MIVQPLACDLAPALGDGGVVVAVDADHLGAAGADRGFLLGRGELRQEDDAAIAEQLGAGRDRAAVVARARRGEDVVAGDPRGARPLITSSKVGEAW